MVPRFGFVENGALIWWEWADVMYCHGFFATTLLAG